MDWFNAPLTRRFTPTISVMPVSMILQWERRILSEEMSHLLQDAAYAAVSQRYPSGILTPDATSTLVVHQRYFAANIR